MNLRVTCNRGNTGNRSNRHNFWLGKFGSLREPNLRVRQHVGLREITGIYGNFTGIYGNLRVTGNKGNTGNRGNRYNFLLGKFGSLCEPNLRVRQHFGLREITGIYRNFMGIYGNLREFTGYG